jgi:hypothetical protein
VLHGLSKCEECTERVGEIRNAYGVLIDYLDGRGLGWRSGKGAALLVGRSRDRFPVVSLDFSVTYFLPIVPWPWGRLSP